ncbi:hypothetical protein CDO52_26520 [Nocardiopsis gilva YIM 90087]|uniref:Peptidase M48 domain-containing protein n=1 Tax=Nocardiopsis gilva YIM 90087 TaxID=1235441 RepID=A0A223SCP9_9ACTN|nr:M48 family metalloprotease [Nocardiopsis gilva]ASU85880.1 hypothetical protein CDO52_26520 [Nocardiopsis gilva YIM 90087]
MAADRGTEARPNPFAFPADTAIRFLLLASAVLSAVPLLTFGFGRAVAPGTSAELDEAQECLAAVIRNAPDSGGVSSLDKNSTKTVDAIKACPETDYTPIGVFLLSIIAVLVVLAVVRYMLMPRARIRRQGLVPLPAEGMPELRSDLDQLCARAGVDRAEITFLLALLDRRVSGLAFGRFGRRYVLLRRGLVESFTTDPPLFRAIVLHELAHIRNGDIDATYLTVALWRTFVVFMLVPALILTPIRIVVAGWERGLGISVRLLVLVLIVLLVRNAVLRSRERHADARVEQWGAGRDLRRALAAVPLQRSGVWSWFSTHPVPSARRTALDESRMVGAVRVGDGLLLGIVAVYAYQTFPEFIGWIIPGGGSGRAAASAAMVALVAVSVTRPVLADAVAACVTRTRISVNAFGIGLGLGIAIGPQVAVISAIRPGGTPHADLASPGALEWLVWSSIVIATTWFCVRWLAETARAWMPYLSSRWTPGRVFFAGTVLAFGLFLWLPYLLGVPGFVAFGSVLVIPDVPRLLILVGVIALNIVTSPWATVTCLAALWVVPLAGSLARGGATRPWVWLQPAEQAGYHRALGDGERRTRTVTARLLLLHAPLLGLTLAVAVIAAGTLVA